jgi:hypothetical protein
LGLNATKKAFKEAFGEAYGQFEKQYPQWVENYFDASFFQHGGAPVLAQFLLRDGHPEASELAARWTEYLNTQQPERHSFYISELEPVAADFLDNLTHKLKSKPELRELNDSRVFERVDESLQALRQKLGAEKATDGSRRDYLHWLIGRNFYLDPRGTFQTQRQVQLKLDEVYISLRAQLDETPTADRQVLEKELAELEIEVATSNLQAEEIEDRRELLHAQFESRLTTKKSGEVLELAEVVTRYDRVVILGDPGSGKTTLLRYLVLKHAEALLKGRTEAGADLGLACFPILIRIADYAENDTWKKISLSDFLADSYILHDCPKSGLADLLQTELEKGHCLILLDGLDEIVSADERLGVVKQIEDFVRRHDNNSNRFVITSRIAGYRSTPLGEPFTQYTVREMDETQMHRFLERWCQAVENAETPELPLQERKRKANLEIDGIMRAAQNPGVRRLAINPLLLRTLALIHRTGAQLPQKRIELYKLATDTLARTWRPAQGVPESALIKDEYLTPMLSELANYLHVHKPTGIATEREVYEVLGEKWAYLNDLKWDADDPSPRISEEVRKFLVKVREHTGLFVERAPKRFGFMHLTFEEYYVARYLVARSRTRAKSIRDHLADPRWEEPILLALGFVGLEYPAEAGELLETAILADGEEAKEIGFKPSPYEDLLGRDYLFALRCLGDNIPVRPKILKRLVERLVNELLYQAGSAQFERYREALSERLEQLEGSDGATTLSLYIIGALHNPEASVRSAAAQALRQVALTSAEAVTALLNALEHDPEASVRSAAVQALRQVALTSAEVVTALLNALEHDPEAEIRYQITLIQGELGQVNPEVITMLIEALLNSTSWSVRQDSARFMGQLGQSDEATVQALWRGLLDEDNDVRTACAQALAQLGRRFATATKAIEMKLFQAIQDPEFDKPDSQYSKRSGHDYAYDGLWLLVVGGEIE